MDNVKAELAERGLSTEAIAALEPILSIDGTVNQRLERLAEVLSASPTGLRGVEELLKQLDFVDKRVGAYYVGVALIKLSITAFLGAVGTPHRYDVFAKNA